MGRSLGRALAHAAFALLTAAAHRPGAASAQDAEEVIADPELGGGGSAPPNSPSGDETIADPELGETAGAGQDFGWGKVFKPPAPEPGVPEEEEFDPLANTGIAKLELLGQIGADLRHEGGLEDAYESRLRFGGEIEFRRSRKLRLMIGSRVDFFWAVPSQDDPEVTRLKERAVDEDRFEVDVLPTAAYADMTLGDGFHLRIGEQVVSMGRMDFYSPADILVVYDMRPQPKLDLGSNKLAQPALRMDWDLNGWATLQAVYVPWFMPHLTRPNRDQYVASVLGGRGAALLPERLGGLIDPSFQPKSSEANLRFVGPPPDFSNPQAEARLNFRGSGLEFALSGGTALEKLPTVYTTPLVDDYVRNPVANGDTERLIGSALSSGVPVLDVEYHRYYLLAIDGSFDISPVSIGFEFAYSPERHMYAATKDGSHIVQPNVTEQIVDSNVDMNVTTNVTDRKIRKGVPTVQGALHVEWLKGESFALISEVFWINLLELPYDKSRDWAGFIPKTGAYMGGMVGLSYTVNEGQWRFDFTAISTVGPSLVAVPHIQLQARENLFIDVGAQFFEGPAPMEKDPANPGRQRPVLNGPQAMNLGALMSGYDQVFAGIRWLP